MSKRALITGVGGQDGALLAALLLDAGYDVAGVVRREPTAYAERLGDMLSLFARYCRRRTSSKMVAFADLNSSTSSDCCCCSIRRLVSR